MESFISGVKIMLLSYSHVVLYFSNKTVDKESLGDPNNAIVAKCESDQDFVLCVLCLVVVNLHILSLWGSAMLGKACFDCRISVF